jgi:hypothetical protein
MSAGLGRIEQAILDALREHPGADGLTTKTLVKLVYGTAPAGPFIPHGASAAQVASVARAVRSLHRKGQVELVPAGGARRRRHVRLSG